MLNIELQSPQLKFPLGLRRHPICEEIKLVTIFVCCALKQKLRQLKPIILLLSNLFLVVAEMNCIRMDASRV
jgi:hypothetical protein